MALWWLVTWTTYGSWLPGDRRGFQTRRCKEYVPPPPRYAKAGEPTYDSEVYRPRWNANLQLCPNAVRLTRDEQCDALVAMVIELQKLSVTPRIIALAPTHGHLIAQFGALMIRPTVGRLKAHATRALTNPGNRKRVWSDQCHMESLPNEWALQNGVEYLRRHHDQGALLFEWIKM